MFFSTQRADDGQFLWASPRVRDLYGGALEWVRSNPTAGYQRVISEHGEFARGAFDHMRATRQNLREAEGGPVARAWAGAAGVGPLRHGLSGEAGGTVGFFRQVDRSDHEPESRGRWRSIGGKLAAATAAHKGGESIIRLTRVERNSGCG